MSEHDTMYSICYIGRAAINSYFSDSMLPWIIGEIELNRRLQNITIYLSAHCIDLKRDFVTRIPSSSGNSITSPDGLESLSEDLMNFDDIDVIEKADDTSPLNLIATPGAGMETIVEIEYSKILHTRVVNVKQSSYFVLVIQDVDKPIYCHAFKSDLNVLNIINTDIEKRIKVERQSGMPCIFTKSAKGSESPSDNDCVRFEVLLVGVVNLKNPDPPHTLIDQAIAEFEERYKQLGESKIKNGGGVEIGHSPISPGFIDSGSPNCMMDDSRESSIDMMRQMRQRCSSIGHANNERPTTKRRQRHSSEPTVLGSDTRKTRIRLFQIGHSSIKMICPNKTVRTCEIEFANISRCMQGIKHMDHFGMIANTGIKATKSNQQSGKKLSCFVFQCSDENICEEIMQGIRQAFATSFNEASPMDEFDSLCKKMNSASTDEASLIVGRKMKKLSENEVSMLTAQVVEINPKNRQDRLSALMAALRRLYEIKHIKHSDNSKSVGGLNVNNGVGSPTSKFDNIKSMAITSFGSLIQKGKKKMLELHLDTDHFADKLATSPVHRIKHFSDGFSTSAPSTPQKLNSALGSSPQNIVKALTRSRSRSTSLGSKPKLLDLSNECKKDMPLLFYHKIFYGITNTGPSGTSTAAFTYTSSAPRIRPQQSLDTVEDIRKAWKWAIGYKILLNKINAIANPKPVQVSRPTSCESYEYSELSEISDQMEDVWMELFRISHDDKEKIDKKVLCAAVRKGVLNSYRGRIWKLLQSQCHRIPTADNEFDMNGYQKLLDNLTPYQHAILIDIGRTFPTHPMYRQLLGPGQLSLFNVLKAYSLFDQDVGYCQGLSFIAGVLLMHTCIEDEAYQLLYCIMHEIECRSMYLPDMKGMKLAMYKMTRLLYDKENEVFQFFQTYEITMMLVATPWFLTMFASTFPMGFVARVFDMVFVDGISAIFKVALCLIAKHKETLLQLDDFEDLVNYIKNDIPQSENQTLMDVIDAAMVMSIESKLQEYETEYRVMSEELPLINYFRDSRNQLEDQIHCLENVNAKVTESNCELLQQLQDAQQKVASMQKQLKNANKH